MTANQSQLAFMVCEIQRSHLVIMLKSSPQILEVVVVGFLEVLSDSGYNSSLSVFASEIISSIPHVN